jgi:carbonic anhydrase
MSSNWSFSNKSEWNKLYKRCSNDNQSPINIDKEKVRICNLMCQLKLKYKSSSCKISNSDNLINILYDEGSYIQYKSDNTIKYNLFKCVPHIPSLHKINDISYDMEFCLYHKNSSGKLLIISVMMNENDNFSNSQDFLNQFIPNLKNINYNNLNDKKDESNKLDYDYSIGVASNWNIENVLPILKNFFVYKGTLPYPPCTNDVLWIIYENSVNISKNDFSILKDRLGTNNSREIYALNANPKISRFVYYNNNIGINIGSGTKGKVIIKCKKIENNSLNFLEKEKSNNKNNNNNKNKNNNNSNSKEEDFFKSSIWINLKFILIWIIILYIAYIFIAPSIGYSYTYNKTLFEFKQNGKELFKETYDITKMNEDYVRKLIEKYLFKKLRIIDLSTDTWFNQYLIRIPHHVFSSVIASLTGKSSVKNE